MEKEDTLLDTLVFCEHIQSCLNTTKVKLVMLKLQHTAFRFNSKYKLKLYKMDIHGFPQQRLHIIRVIRIYESSP